MIVSHANVTLQWYMMMRKREHFTSDLKSFSIYFIGESNELKNLA